MLSRLCATVTKLKRMIREMKEEHYEHLSEIRATFDEVEEENQLQIYHLESAIREYRKRNSDTVDSVTAAEVSVKKAGNKMSTFIVI